VCICLSKLRKWRGKKNKRYKSSWWKKNHKMKERVTMMEKEREKEENKQGETSEQYPHNEARREREN